MHRRRAAIGRARPPRPRPRLGLPVLAVCAGLLASALADDGAGLAGSASCRECHPKFHELWSTSRHGLALQPFTEEFARRSLPRQEQDLDVGAFRYRWLMGSEGGAVRETGPNGEILHPITHVLGGRDVIYFLTPAARGRLQVLPLAYDAARAEWYGTEAGVRGHGSGADPGPVAWRDRAFTFNASCFTCHVSYLEKGYQPATDSYQTTWAEPGISCEVCHGPSAAHERACREAAPGKPPADLKIRGLRHLAAGERNAVCAPCHAKMTPLTGTFAPSERYFDHFTLALLDDPDFSPDGRELGETYTLTAWSMNRCAIAGGLECLHCHTSSGRNRHAGPKTDEACLPCHAARVADPGPHTHHAAGSPGSRCVDCHMPTTEFARMRRSDHSFRPPAPAATLAFGSPNACSLCHTNETVDWAEQHAQRWYGDRYAAEALERGRLVAAARARDWSRMADWASYLARPNRDPVTAASIVRLLVPCREPAKWPLVMRALEDVSPMVRAAAVDHLAGHATPERLPALLAAARDDCRWVRVRAAVALASVPSESIEPSNRPTVQRAFTEYEAALAGQADDPHALADLGAYWTDRGEWPQAIRCFQRALRLDPHHVGALAEGAQALELSGRRDEALAWLEQARKDAPTNATVNLNLGLLLVRQGRMDEAENRLKDAWAADPTLAAVPYNLGILVATDPARQEEAIAWLRRAVALQPGEPRFTAALARWAGRKPYGSEAPDPHPKTPR